MPNDTQAPAHGVGHVTFRTTCGRDVRIGRLALVAAERPAERISVDIGPSAGGDDGTWDGLTPAEARRLAGALLAHAAAAERDAAPSTSSPAAEGRIDVAYAGGESYAIATRGHALLTDQPTGNGGVDAAPTPTELLVGALASCVGFYTGRYLERHSLQRDGVHVSAEFTMATDRPARVGAIRLRISVPAGVPAGRRAALLAVASHCTVHNTLRHEPVVTVDLT
jgi:putative redox protein